MFYYWANYQTNSGFGELLIVQWLGVSNKVIQMTSYWVLRVSGHVIFYITVKGLTNSERNTYEWSKLMREYDITI